MHSEPCVFGGWAGRQTAFQSSYFVQNIDDSPQLSYRWHSPLFVCMDSVYLCPSPHSETSRARVNYYRICVSVCDSPLSLSVCPLQRGVVLMTLPRRRSSWTSAGWDFVPCCQTGWRGWLTRQRYQHMYCTCLLHFPLMTCYNHSRLQFSCLTNFSVMSSCA